MSLKFSFLYYYILAESKTMKDRDDFNWCSNCMVKCVLQKYGWRIHHGRINNQQTNNI